MKKIYFLSIVVAVCSSLISGCSKKEETTAPSSNIATEVVANLNAVSANYAPDSLAAASVGLAKLKADPCQGVSDFAICQSNLIREYNSIGKDVVDAISQITGQVGAALGQVPDGNSGTSTDGKISWSKTNSSNWSLIARGLSNQSYVYVSVAGSTYTLKIDGNSDEAGAKNQQIEAVVNFTNTNSWTIDVFFSNLVCDATDPGSPNKFQLKLGFDGSLWTGKAMLYAGRWKAPAATVTCSTTYGNAANEIAMYTDYVGNDISTKAALYLIPASNNNLAAISNFDFNDFCTNFASSCNGMGQPTAGYLASYPNPWCTTGAATNPTWGSTCPTNAAVTGASFSNTSNWITPSVLKIKTVTLPTSL